MCRFNGASAILNCKVTNKRAKYKRKRQIIIFFSFLRKRANTHPNLSKHLYLLGFKRGGCYLNSHPTLPRTLTPTPPQHWGEGFPKSWTIHKWFIIAIESSCTSNRIILYFESSYLTLQIELRDTLNRITRPFDSKCIVIRMELPTSTHDFQINGWVLGES